MHEAPNMLGAGVNLVGALFLLRHYARLIAEPFLACGGFVSVLKTLFTMNDATFLGVLTGTFFALAFAYDNARLFVQGLRALLAN
jgi:hypothetical protein